MTNSGRTSITGKSFFDLTEKEKEEVLSEAAKQANTDQAELMNKCRGAGHQNGSSCDDCKPKCKCSHHSTVYPCCPDCTYWPENAKPMQESPNLSKPTDQKPIWEGTLSGLMVEQTELWWSYDKCKSGWEKIKVDEKLHDWQIRLKTFIKEVEKAAYERGYMKRLESRGLQEVESMYAFSQGYERGWKARSEHEDTYRKMKGEL